MHYTIRVFISHAWDYSEHYDTLASWMFNEVWNVSGTRLYFDDTSIPKDDPIHYAPHDAALFDAILARIKCANVMIIPAGMYVQHSDWIQIEIACARVANVPILAVSPWAQERHGSTAVDNAQQLVGWNKQSVVDGVWRLFSLKYL